MLFRFTFELSDVDRGVYETLDFRVARHPSETDSYLVTRALAFALAYRPGLEFTPGGLHDPDQPALQCMGPNGVECAIEIGNPSAKRLHKTSKNSREVLVYTYKNPGPMLEELRGEKVHRLEDIRIFAIDPKFLGLLESRLEKTNRWTVLHHQGNLSIGIGDDNYTGEIKQRSTQ
jgi:uncharacterized protein YaeQ